MSSSLPADPSRAPHRILELAARDRSAARAALAELSAEERVALVCETPLARRGALLDLLPDPERVVPRLPEAELCFTLKAIGLADSAWVLEHATDEQIAAAVDLDAWSGTAPDPARFDGWMEAFAGASDATLLRAVHTLDTELLVLWLADRIEVVTRPEGEEREGWSPPPGAHSLDGVFFLVARRPDDDVATVLRLLHLLFQKDYWLYFRILQGVSWELTTETEEWALRWRTGRLQDLGFPPREEAAAIYARVPRRDLDRLPESQRPVPLPEWSLPVWMPELPGPLGDHHLVFRAARELEPGDRRAFFYAFVALANHVAVANDLPLGEAESIPRALETAAATASRGLAHLAERNALSAAEILRRASLTWIFRVGASLDRERGGS